MSTSKLIINQENLDYPVSLKEYYSFEEDNYIVLTLNNNLNQVLNSLSFVILTYDETNNLIEKLNVNVVDINKSANSTFTLTNKLTVSPKTKSIKYQLVKAEFSSVIYENNKIINKPLNFKEEVNKDKKTKVEKVKNPSIETKKALKVVSLKKKSKYVLAHIFTILFGALALGLFLTFTIIYKDDIPIIYDGGSYELTLEQKGDGYIITDFSGEANDLVLEEKYYNKPLLEIDSNSFVEADIKNLEIKSPNLIIGMSAFTKSTLEYIYCEVEVGEIGIEAFYECNDLKEVVLPVNGQVRTNAFRECQNLTTLDLGNNSIIGPKICYNTKNLESLTYGDINKSLTYLYQIFDESMDVIPYKFKYIECNMKHISYYFLEGFSQISRRNFKYPRDAEVEPGALNHLGA